MLAQVESSSQQRGGLSIVGRVPALCSHNSKHSDRSHQSKHGERHKHDAHRGQELPPIPLSKCGADGPDANCELNQEEAYDSPEELVAQQPTIGAEANRTRMAKDRVMVSLRTLTRSAIVDHISLCGLRLARDCSASPCMC